MLVLPKAKKDSEYSKLLLGEGNDTPVDADSSYEMHLPPWADADKIKLAQRFFLLNINAMIHALYLGLIAIASSPTLLKVLMFTKQSSTTMLSYRRYKANVLHLQAWYKYPLQPGTRAWRSLAAVRRMHLTVSKKSDKAGSGIISQKDMAITQFTFMGMHLYCPDKLGIVGSHEQFEAFNHLWRVIGYMLGTEDQYNLCGETWSDTRNRCEALKEDLLIPGLQFSSPEFENYTRIAVDGMKFFEPIIHYETIIYFIKRLLGLPNHHYFESEALSPNSNNTKVIQQLGLYTRFRVFLNVIIYQFLTPMFIFRWIFNIFRIISSLLDKYPVLAIWKFGKKNAYVQILKANKAN